MSALGFHRAWSNFPGWKSADCRDYFNCAARGRLLAEWKKLGAEKELGRLEEELAGCDRNLPSAVRMMAAYLRAGRQKDALTWIDEVIKRMVSR
jgi:hypothetical protein